MVMKLRIIPITNRIRKEMMIAMFLSALSSTRLAILVASTTGSVSGVTVIGDFFVS